MKMDSAAFKNINQVSFVIWTAFSTFIQQKIRIDQKSKMATIFFQ